MKLPIAIFAAVSALFAQDGEPLYRAHCSVPYCHGAGGAAGRAPALGGRKFDRGVLRTIVAKGIPARGMPGFENKLPDKDLDAVVDYVLSLPSPAPVLGRPKPTPGAPPPPKLSRDAAAGRELFFDSERLPGCSACHAIGTMGESIGPALTAASFERARSAEVRGLQTAHVAGEAPFPALVVETAAGLVRLYDLGAKLPVLRSLVRSDVRLVPGSAWSHASVVEKYTDAELRSMAEYARAAVAAR